MSRIVRERRHHLRLFVLCTILLALAAGVGGYVGGRSVFDQKRPHPPGVPGSSALAQLRSGVAARPTGTPTATVPVPAKVRSALSAALSDPRLGPSVLADLKQLLVDRGYEEGSIASPGDFVLEKAFVET